MLKQEVTQVRGLILIFRGDWVRREEAGVLWYVQHLCVLWQSELRTGAQDRLRQYPELWTSKWVKCSNQVTLGLHHWHKNPRGHMDRRARAARWSCMCPQRHGGPFSGLFQLMSAYLEQRPTLSHSDPAPQGHSSSSKLLINLLQWAILWRAVQPAVGSALLLRVPWPLGMILHGRAASQWDYSTRAEGAGVGPSPPQEGAGERHLLLQVEGRWEAQGCWTKGARIHFSEGVHPVGQYGQESPAIGHPFPCSSLSWSTFVCLWWVWILGETVRKPGNSFQWCSSNPTAGLLLLWNFQSRFFCFFVMSGLLVIRGGILEELLCLAEPDVSWSIILLS